MQNLKKKDRKITTQIISEKILELLKQNPTMSRKTLAEVLVDITEDGVKYHLDKLKEEGKIERIGGTRVGMEGIRKMMSKFG